MDVSVLVATKAGSIMGPIASVFGYIMDFLFRITSSMGIMNIGLCIILFTTEGGTVREWSDPQLWCILAFGLIGIAGFIYEERLAFEPIIPLSLFRNRSFLLCSLIGFIIGMSLFGSVTFLLFIISKYLFIPHSQRT